MEWDGLKWMIIKWNEIEWDETNSNAISILPDRLSDVTLNSVRSIIVENKQSQEQDGFRGRVPR
jgi:hypothetical protein